MQDMAETLNYAFKISNSQKRESSHSASVRKWRMEELEVGVASFLKYES